MLTDKEISGICADSVIGRKREGQWLIAMSEWRIKWRKTKTSSWWSWNDRRRLTLVNSRLVGSVWWIESKREQTSLDIHHQSGRSHERSQAAHRNSSPKVGWVTKSKLRVVARRRLSRILSNSSRIMYGCIGGADGGPDVPIDEGGKAVVQFWRFTLGELPVTRCLPTWVHYWHTIWNFWLTPWRDDIETNNAPPSLTEVKFLMLCLHGLDRLFEAKGQISCHLYC